MGHVDDLLDIMLPLFHVVGEMPARRTELLCLKIRNTWSTQRNFYLVDGLMMFCDRDRQGNESAGSAEVDTALLITNGRATIYHVCC